MLTSAAMFRAPPEFMTIKVTLRDRGENTFNLNGLTYVVIAHSCQIIILFTVSRVIVRSSSLLTTLVSSSRVWLLIEKIASLFSVFGALSLGLSLMCQDRI